jgi:hypothetical protein
MFFLLNDSIRICLALAEKGLVTCGVRVVVFACLDLPDFEAQELALVWLEEWKSHLVDVKRVDALDGLTLKGTVEEDTEEVGVSLDDTLDDSR